MKRTILALMIAALMTVPAAAQFGTVAQAPIVGTACNYAPTLGIDMSTGEVSGCGNDHIWKGFSGASGSIKLTEAAAPTGVAGFDFLYADLSAHALKMINNNGSADVVAGLASTQTFSGKSFNQNIVPLSAGATDLGSTALPWGNMWLGAAATNNFKFQPAALSAARVITVPDPGGNATMAYTNATTPQVMSGLQSFTGNKVQLTSDFTDANSASLQAITGLAITFPSGFAGNINVHCVLSYTQATPSAGDQFGIGVTTTAPTRADAFSIVATNATTVQQGFLNNLTSTTPTASVTFTPAVSTQLVSFLDATLQLGGAGAQVFQVYVLNGTAANVIVTKAGSGCTAF